MTLTDLQAGVAALLLGLSLVAFPEAYRRLGRVFETPLERRVLGGAVAAAAVARWFVAPKWLVTMYIGYLQTEQAIELQADSHYGLGSQALYHALFALLPHDHATVMWANAVIGVATVPLVAGLCARLFSDRRVGLVLAWLVALTPLFVKNDASEANQVPALWSLFGGLLLLEAYVVDRERRVLAAATVLLAFAAIGRPELPVLVGASIVAVVVIAGRRPDRPMLVAGLMLGLMAVPHMVHVQRAAARLAQVGGLDTWHAGGVLPGLARSLGGMNTLLKPTLYPAALTGLAAFAMLRGAGPMRSRAVVALLSLAAIALYGLDLCVANMARVHVPGALFATMLAASGAVGLVSIPWMGARSQAFSMLVAAVFGASAVPSIRRLWAPTNEQAEEEFLREAIASLPVERPFTLVRPALVDRNTADPNSSQTHHHFPDYLARSGALRGRPASITDWLQDSDPGEEAYFVRNMRCYALLRSDGVPAPHGDNLQPACAKLLERFDLEPVYEVQVPNRGDVWLAYYGDAPALTLGLYRIRPKGSLSP